jgi:hypothetical protein
MTYDTSVIRQFIKTTFDTFELIVFCFDYFPDVESDISSDMRKVQIIQILLSYCDRQNKIPSLMAALEREKADPYHEEFGYIQHKKTNTSSTNYKSKQAFISHATKADSHFAHRLASDLEGSGWSVWIAPESIQPGEKWVESINRGLEESRIFLLVLTPDAVVSRWVQSETNVAIEMEHEGLVEFIPLQVKACQVPPLWRAYQYVPFVKGYDFGWQLLLARLNSSLPSVHSSEQKILLLLPGFYICLLTTYHPRP